MRPEAGAAGIIRDVNLPQQAASSSLSSQSWRFVMRLYLRFHRSVLSWQAVFFDKMLCIEQVKVHFPRVGSKATPPHPSGDFKWKDYCPRVFKRLRDVFNINPAQYMLSLCGIARSQT